VPNNLPASFNFVGPDGRVINSIDSDSNRQGRLVKAVKPGEIGQNTLKVRYTGDNAYVGGAVAGFTAHMGGSTKSTTPYVTKIVAGPGIYISAPNGQGVVTVSTKPLPVAATTQTLVAICWPNIYNIPAIGDMSQFTTGGIGGVNLRSRDGKTFVQMDWPAGIDIVGISAEMASEIGDNHVEFNGVNGNKSIYGRLGMVTTSSGCCVESDGMIVVSTLTATSGVVSGLVSTFAFMNGLGYSGSTGGGGGGGGGASGSSGASGGTGAWSVSNFFLYDPTYNADPVTTFSKSTSYFGAVCYKHTMTTTDAANMPPTNTNIGYWTIEFDGVGRRNDTTTSGNRTNINSTSNQYYDNAGYDLTNLTVGSHTAQIKVYSDNSRTLLISQSAVINFTVTA
jgi:hypothetical protein